MNVKVYTLHFTNGEIYLIFYKKADAENTKSMGQWVQEREVKLFKCKQENPKVKPMIYCLIHNIMWTICNKAARKNPR